MYNITFKRNGDISNYFLPSSIITSVSPFVIVPRVCF